MLINICNRRNPDNELCVLEYNHETDCVFMPRTDEALVLMIESRNRVSEKLQDERDKVEQLQEALTEIMSAHNIRITSREKREPKISSGLAYYATSRGQDLREEAEKEDRKDAAIITARQTLEDTKK